MNLLTIQNGNTSYFVQNERYMYASSGDFVYIFFSRASTVSVILPFLQLHRQRKMAARFVLHGDHQAKVVLSGTPLLRPVYITERSLTPCNTKIYCMFSPMQIQWNHFLGI